MEKLSFDYMNSKFFGKFFVMLMLVLISISFSYSAFPNFSFTDNTYAGGVINVSGQISSGVELSLYINNIYISKQDVRLPAKTVELNSDLTDIEVGVGQNLILVNTNQDLTKVYKINISSKNIYKELSNLQQVQFVSDVSGDFSIVDEATGIEKKISVVDKMNNFSFDNMQNDLNDGNNNLKFIYRYPLSTKTNSETFNKNVTYNKYYNKIFVTNFTNVTNQKSVTITGKVRDVVSPLYYVVNHDGSFSNIGGLNPVVTKNGKFNFTTDSGLIEGNNSIRLITVDPSNHDIFNGETKLNLLVDTINPTISFATDLKLKTNEDALKLNFSTDAILINYTFNNVSTVLGVINNSVNFDLTLKKGDNSLVLEAVDEAGNTYKEAHHIKFSDTNPKLLIKDMKPKDLFTGSHTAHFQFQSLEGKTNEGNVKITVFAIPEGTTVPNSNGDSVKVTCDDYRSSFIRVVQPDQYTNNQYGTDIPDNQVDISPAPLFSKKTFTTDADGNFGGNVLSGNSVIISLQDKSYTDNLNNDKGKKSSAEVKKVNSRNQICFQMVDEYGNIGFKSYSVTLDAGNTLWKANDISTTPNTLYAAEIEQGDSQVGVNGHQRFSMIARFKYLGQGTVKTLSGFRVTNDRASKDKNFRVITNELQYVLDTKTNEMVVYVPVEILPLNIKPLDYPKSLDFSFQASVTYTVDNTNIPIDTLNPIYFKTSINIESPFDHTKWLTPAMIKKGQKFLNKTIAITKKAKDIMGITSVVGVLSCTAAKFVYGSQIGLAEAKEAVTAQDKADKLKEINGIKKKLYQICDRVFCSASPLECSDEERDKLKTGLNFGDNTATNGKVFKKPELDDLNIVSKDKNGVGSNFKMSSLSCKGACDSNGDGKDDGVYCSGDYQTYSGGDGGIWTITKKSTAGKFVDQCYPLNKDNQNLDITKADSACYTGGTPNFDDTRCPTLGVGTPLKGWNPADNIIESVACGCITDTYSHLGNILQVEQGIYQCLQQAKLGVVKGSYCERLLSQAVCDVATNVVFKTILQKSSRDDLNGKPAKRGALDTLNNIGNGIKLTDNDLTNRYDGNKFYSAMGFSQDEIVNKVCVAGISGDWSMLTDSILNNLDKNQVEPQFGPMVAESRMNGYNPLTGDLTVQYRFTYGVLSGGQEVDSKYYFICDPQSSNGDNCPTNMISTEDPASLEFTSLKNVQYSVAAKQSRQDTIVLYDKKANVWFNKIKVVHTFEINGEQKTVVNTEPIIHKGEITMGCHFSTGIVGAGAGFSCNKIFGSGSVISAYQVSDNTKIVPSKKIFYPGNKVFLDFNYNIRQGADSTQTDFQLVGLATCNANGGGSTKKIFRKDFVVNPTKNSASVNYNILEDKFLTSGNLGTRGRAIINFMDIPSVLGVQDNNKVMTYYVKLSDKDYKLLKDKKNLEILVKSDNSKNSVSYNIASKTGFDFLEGLNDYYIGQNLNINIKSNSPHEIKDLDGSSMALNRLTNPYLKIVFKSIEGNINLYLSDGDKSYPFIKLDNVKSSNEDFANLKAGKCTLDLQIVPQSQADTVNYDNFANFNSESQDNLIKSENLKSNSIKSLTFTIAKPRSPASETPNNYIDIVNPQPNTVICAKVDDVTNEITNTPELNVAIIGSSEDDFDTDNDYTFTYSLSLNTKGKIKSKESKNFNFEDNEYKFEINNFDWGDNKFDSNSYYDGKLVYELTQKIAKHKNYKGDNVPEKTKTISSKSIPIRISTGCNENGVKSPAAPPSGVGTVDKGNGSGKEKNKILSQTKDVVPPNK